MCAKFQGDRNTRLCFIAIFQSVRKDEEKKFFFKNEEIKTNIWALISGKWLRRFSSNLVCGVVYLADTFAAKLVPIG